MTWWPWLSCTWLALGTGGILTAKLAIRASGSSDPLSLDDGWRVTVGAGLVLILAGPMLALFMLGLCIQTICKGRIPISDRVWWQSWAMKFPDVPAPPALEDHSPEGALCRLIALRRLLDGRLLGREAPEHWPMWMLWETTEAAMLGIIEQYYWLCDGGLTAQAALQKIDAAQPGAAASGLESNSSLRSYIAARLTTDDPGFVALGTDLLNEAIEIAETWSIAKITRTKAERPYPPSEWLKARVDASDIEAEAALPFKDGGLVMVTDGVMETPGTTVPIDRKWHRIALRMVPGDELWTFSSPPEYWQGLAGRMGVALIRKGHPIGHINTMMN